MKLNKVEQFKRHPFILAIVWFIAAMIIFADTLYWRADEPKVECHTDTECGCTDNCLDPATK